MRIVAGIAVLVLSACTGSAADHPPNLTGSNQPPSGTASDPFRALGSPALELPPVASGQACPTAKPHDLGDHLGLAFGDGPVYALGADGLGAELRRNAGTHSTKLAWAAAPTYTGPIRIRGARIDGSGSLLLDAPDNQFHGAAVKTVDGTALVTELDFLETHSRFPNVPSDWRLWPSGTYVESPGCYAWQIDGIGFREIIPIQI
jgi:hypothetical protein